MAGYSATPLVKKLGYKAGFRACLKNPPPNYLQMIDPLPDGAIVSSRLRRDIDLYHLFTKNRQELVDRLPQLMSAARFGRRESLCG